MGSVASRWVWALGLAAICVWAGVDFLTWILADSAPITHGDSARHALSSMEWATEADRGPLALRAFIEPGYYPKLVYWLAIPFQRLWGPSADAFHLSFAAWSSLLALGTGLLAHRYAGRAAGLAAAAMTLSLPVFWLLRGETMLDLPLAAMVPLALALLPGVDRRGWRWAVGAGVALALGMLCKQSMAFFVPPALGVVLVQGAWVGGRGKALAGVAALVALPLVALAVAGPVIALGVALVSMGAAWAWIRRHIRAGHPAYAGLGDALLCVLVAGLLAGPWSALSWSEMLAGIQVTAAKNQVPGGWPGVVRVVAYLEYLLRGFLTFPHVVLLVGGLVASVVLWWRGPRPIAALLGLVVGFIPSYSRACADVAPGGEGRT